MTHSQTETLKDTGSPCNYIFYLVEDGPLCRHRIRAKRVIFNNLFHFNFIKIRCNFFWYTLISDGVLSWVSWLNLFMENIDVAVCASLPWGLATWRESVEADCQSAIYKATRPEYCIAFHHVLSHSLPEVGRFEPHIIAHIFTIHWAEGLVATNGTFGNEARFCGAEGVDSGVAVQCTLEGMCPHIPIIEWQCLLLLLIKKYYCIRL